MGRPNLSADQGQKELEKADKQFQSFSENIQNMTLDHLNKTPANETEPQVKISNREQHKAEAIYLKPTRTIGSKEKFNEKYREDYKREWEYVMFVAENNEVKGETIHLWTKCFPGEDACEWKIPVNKPVRGPRHLANRLTQCNYHRLKTDDGVVTEQGSGMTYHGCIVVDETVNRLNAKPTGSPFVAMGS